MWKNVTFPFISSVSTNLARDNSEKILAFRNIHIYFCDFRVMMTFVYPYSDPVWFSSEIIVSDLFPISADRDSNTHQTPKFWSDAAMQLWKTFYFILTNWYLWLIQKNRPFMFFFWQSLLHNLICLLFSVLFFQLFTVFYMIKGIVFEPKIKGTGSLFLSYYWRNLKHKNDQDFYTFLVHITRIQNLALAFC